MADLGFMPSRVLTPFEHFTEWVQQKTRQVQIWIRNVGNQVLLALVLAFMRSMRVLDRVLTREWVQQKKRQVQDWIRNLILGCPSPLAVLLLIPMLVGYGVGVRLFVNGPDGELLAKAIDISSTDLWWRGFFSCSCCTLVIVALQLVLSKLKEKGWNRTESVLKSLVKSALGIGFYFLSMYLAACVVTDQASFTAVVILTWSMFLSLLLASLLVTSCPEDFGYSDCFVAANLGIAIKMPPSVATLICPGGKKRSKDESKWKWEWNHVLARFFIGVGPIAMKLFISDYLESCIKWAKAGNSSEEEATATSSTLEGVTATSSTLEGV